MLDVDVPCVVLQCAWIRCACALLQQQPALGVFFPRRSCQPSSGRYYQYLRRTSGSLLLGCMRWVSGHTEDFCVDVHINKLCEHTTGVSLKGRHMALSSTTCCTICLSFWFEAGKWMWTQNLMQTNPLFVVWSVYLHLWAKLLGSYNL